MPQNKYALARYYIIDSLLHRFDYVKTNSIVDCCRQRLGYSISQRTIQMDIESMRNDSFLNYYAPIDYCKRRKAYYYSNQNYQLLPFYFSMEEICTLEHIHIYVSNKVEFKYIHAFEKLIKKIKIFSEESIIVSIAK